MKTKFKIIFLAVLSVLMFYFTRLYIVNNLFWDYLVPEEIYYNYNSFFSLPWQFSLLFLIILFINAMVTNLFPYLVIKLRWISEQSIDYFANIYLIGLFIFLSLLIWHLIERNFYVFQSWSRIYGLTDIIFSLLIGIVFFIRVRKII